MIVARQNDETRTVNEIAKNIRLGVVHPDITEVSIRKKLIQRVNPKSNPKRSDLLEAQEFWKRAPGAKGKAGTIQGPKGQAHGISDIVQHIEKKGYIPDTIKNELVNSKHYLVPGQTPQNPSGAPKSRGSTQGGAAKTNTGTRGASRSAGGRRPRDLDSLYERDLEYDDIFARGTQKVTFSRFRSMIKAMERDSAAKKTIIDAINVGGGVTKTIEPLIEKYADSHLEAREANPEAEPVITFENMKSLYETMKVDKAARKEVLKKFNGDVRIKDATNKLADAFVEDEDELKKREEEFFADAFLEARDEYFYELDARDAEPEAEAEFEDHLYARDAFPEFEFEGSF